MTDTGDDSERPLIAHLLELVERHPIALRADHGAQFERILPLHREQVRHLSPASRAAKCTQLPVIDNIEPYFKQSYQTASESVSK